MSKQNTGIYQLKITTEVFNKILSWSQAETEVVFLAAGKGSVITDAFRLTNTADNKRDFFEFCKKEEAATKKMISLNGLNVICMGHSHPRKSHLRHPSRSDFIYLQKLSMQMIVFPTENQIRIWKFKTSYKDTLKNELNLYKI